MSARAAFSAGRGSFPGSLLLLGCMWSDGAAAAAVAAAGLMMVQCCRRSGCRSDDGLMFPGCCMWSDGFMLPGLQILPPMVR